MTARDHNRLLGLFFLIWGGLQLFGIVIAILFMLGFGGLALSNARSGGAAPLAIIFGFSIVALIIGLIFAVPSLLAGLKMRKEQQSAKIWAIIAAILALFSIPLGTALGIYALWFLFSDQGKSFYGSNSGSNFSPPPPNSWQ